MAKIIFINLVLLLACCSCNYSQSVRYLYMKDITSDTTRYAGDFETVSDHVNRNYTHLKSKHMDGLLLQKSYLSQVKQCKTNLAYGDVLVRYFAALNNAHAAAIFKKYYVNCGAALVEKKVFLSYVSDSAFLKNGVREKDELIRVNGTPVVQYLEEQGKYTSASTALHRMYLTVSALFSSYLEESRTYTFRTGAGEKDVTVRFEAQPAGNVAATAPAKVDSKQLNDTVAYINILSMESDVVEQFVTAYEKLLRKPNLIIDVRRNQGGNSGNAEQIAAYLVANEQRACVSGRRINPKSSHYTGRLFVLTSPYTCSAAESFVLDLHESGNATLVGMPTAGDTGNQPKFYDSELGYSYWFPSRDKPQVSGKGFPMEGKSIQPDYPVQRTVADYLKGDDTILNFTLALIGRK